MFSARNTGASSQRRRRQFMRRSWRRVKSSRTKRPSTQAGTVSWCSYMPVKFKDPAFDKQVNKLINLINSLIIKESDLLMRHTEWPNFVFHHSVNQPFKGDYLEISKNPKYQKLNSAVDEKVLLADVVNKINRANGKVRKITGTATLWIQLVKSKKNLKKSFDLK